MYIFNALENHSRKTPVYKDINIVFHFGGRDDLVEMSLHSDIFLTLSHHSFLIVGLW